MKYVEITNQNESRGRIKLIETEKTTRIEFEDVPEKLVESLQKFGIIDVEGGTHKQLFPTSPDKELFLKNLRYEFSGSTYRATEVKNE